MNVKIFSRDELNFILSSSESVYISIFLPSEATSKNVSAIDEKVAEIALSVQTELVELGYSKSLIADLVERIGILKELLRNQSSTESLAVFLAPNLLRCYNLPGNCTGSITVTNRQFYVEPLLPFLAEYGLFYLLTFGQNQIRLWQGAANGLIQISPTALPETLSNLLRLSHRMEQFQVERMVLSSVRTAANPIDVLDEQAENLKQSIQHYCKRLDNHLKAFLEQYKAPLILAGTSHILSLYRRVSTCQQLLRSEISGNPDAMKLDDLHQQAFAIVHRERQLRIQQILKQYQQAKELRHAANHLGEIVSAAANGKIATLLLSFSLEKWGKFNPYVGEVEVHAVAESGDINLSELAAVQTLLNHGQLYAVEPEEMPDQASIAAIFRVTVA